MRWKKNAQTETHELTQMSSGVMKSHKKDTAYFLESQRDICKHKYTYTLKYMHFYNIWVHDLWSWTLVRLGSNFSTKQVYVP